ncbi:lipocalin-like domain-containing protein [Acidicapsa acidisoli]|uniref:lipocalin-like domain-containing protein n=1 Tax=Acidicapsa acidisoli TaxID=1615681 RepID=UPI0021E0D36F|nr:lipocalin-like domain-containing protein [Acidicapsa acidisoli]
MMTVDANLGLQTRGQECFKEFLGSWSLVSFEHVLSTGEVLKPFGDAPLGSILYQADGHMSAQVSALNRPELSSDDPLEASVDEVSDAWRSYLGYWGSYRVFAERRVVVHRVEGSSFPNWVGTEQIRHFHFDESNRLILETHSLVGHFKLTWQKRAD